MGCKIDVYCSFTITKTHHQTRSHLSSINRVLTFFINSVWNWIKKLPTPTLISVFVKQAGAARSARRLDRDDNLKVSSTLVYEEHASTTLCDHTHVNSAEGQEGSAGRATPFSLPSPHPPPTNPHQLQHSSILQLSQEQRAAFLPTLLYSLPPRESGSCALVRAWIISINIHAVRCV